MSTTPTVYFHEDQRFRQSWLWLLVAVASVVAVISRASAPGMTVAAIVATVLTGALIAAIVAFARLETEVRDDRILVRFHGLWPTRRIPLKDIEDYEARRYTLWESGGWGVHFTMRGIAYNVRGNDGVVFRLKKGSGGPVLVGTQRPGEFAEAVRRALANRRTD